MNTGMQGMQGMQHNQGMQGMQHNQGMQGMHANSMAMGGGPNMMSMQGQGIGMGSMGDIHPGNHGSGGFLQTEYFNNPNPHNGNNFCAKVSSG